MFTLKASIPKRLQRISFITAHHLLPAAGGEVGADHLWLEVEKDIMYYKTNTMGWQLIKVYVLLDQKGYVTFDPEMYT